ncbi:lipoprotein LpqV [Mycolicibacterium brumae]|uniref:lipoprotein LpqV n=1 Tax=Mycolicibacterium brumae TaxID=85968 RepID=UPI000A8AB2FC|nr:lipoprotein LpqV [Mycolicibacterium brumae]MCV7191979.1 lipoprotein LpqV [Mycolicibacterium brumae]RWA20650.1 hypothetical protein MBRU_03040 [Mycolicibacterium brumae DSM 44177]UWW07745.1 lipoprotein LpqV [Mycolicibacterium brumae]
MGRFTIMLATGLLSVLAAGCSSAEQDTGPTSEPVQAAEPTTASAVPDGVGVSAAGVTTSVDAPPNLTENGYGQACLAARAWYDEQGGDPLARVEDYLATVQHPEYTGPATFERTWSQLNPGEQAGAILAANSAARGECG